MLLTCPHCGDANELPADRLPPPGARGSCGRCGKVAVFNGSALVPEGGDEDATPPNPLHAQAAADDDTPAHPLDAVAAAEEAAAAGDQWHVSTPAGQQGPLTLVEVKQLIRSGGLGEFDHVYGPGQSDWMAAGEREELHRYFAIKAKADAKAAAVAGTAAAGATTASGSKDLNLGDPFAWCTRHPQAVSAWTCHACSLAWCADCPEERQLPSGTVHTCPNCQRPVAARKHAKPVTLWWTEWGQVWSFPIRGLNSIALVVLCGAWLAQFLSSGAAIIGYLASLIISFAVLSWFVLLVRHVGLGGRGMPNLGNVEDYISDLVIPGVKAVIVKILTVVPVFLYLLFVVTPAAFEYGFAVAEQEAREQREAAPSDWDEEDGSESWAGSSGSPQDEQRTAFIEAMRAMGNSEEQIDEMLAEFDRSQEGEAGGAWGSSPGWGGSEEPEPPNAGGLILRLLGVPVLLLYALVVWPLLLIIVALFNTIAPAFNPPLILRIAKEVWPEYKRLLLVLVPLGILSFVLEWFTEPGLGRGLRVEAMGFPPYFRLLFVPAFFYIQLVMMYLIGRTAELIDRKIDWF